jgi:hypothetical protein
MLVEFSYIRYIDLENREKLGILFSDCPKMCWSPILHRCSKINEHIQVFNICIHSNWYLVRSYNYLKTFRISNKE